VKAVSAELAAAIVSPERQFVQDRLYVDWGNDGYGPAGSIDDLSGHVASVDLDGSLQPDVPDDVRLVEGNAAATLTVGLAGGSPTNDTVPTGTFFSPVAPAGDPDVPLAGLERRFRPCYWEVGLVTDAGPEYVRMFTGFTSNVPVSGNDVQLVAIDNRSLLRDPPQLPALPAYYVSSSGAVIAPGLEATWLVSYAFASGGLYSSPPPRAGIRLWAPMHGSAQPFVHDELGGILNAAYKPAIGALDRCQFVDGPHVAALSSGAVNAGAAGYLNATAAPGGTNLYDQYGRSKGRLEAWALVPAGVPNTLWPIAIQVDTDEGALQLNGGAFPLLQVIIAGNEIADINGPEVSGMFDGGWHFLGLAWDAVAGTYAVRIDSHLFTGTFTPTGTGGVSPGEAWPVYVQCANGSAISDVQVTAGGSPSDPWLMDMAFTAGAVIDRSGNQLVGLVPDSNAADWWELIKNVASAERGTAYFDAAGPGRYRTPAALATTQAQTVQVTLTSLTNVTALKVEPDASRVRNAISCPWAQVTVHSATPDHCYDASDVIALPPGRTVTLPVTLKGPTIGNSLGITAAINTQPDGSGTSSSGTAHNTTKLTIGSVTVTVTLLTSTTASVAISNSTGGWRYVCDTTGQAALGLLGVYTSVDTSVADQTAQDDASIAEFGRVGLPYPASVWRQSAGWAAGIAAQTLADLRDPPPAITDLECVGDPRVEFFDRAAIQDSTGQRLNGEYWIKSRKYGRTADGLTMTVAATLARNIAVFDDPTGPGFDEGAWS
jgi:hypothetical protein